MYAKNPNQDTQHTRPTTPGEITSNNSQILKNIFGINWLYKQKRFKMLHRIGGHTCYIIQILSKSAGPKINEDHVKTPPVAARKINFMFLSNNSNRNLGPPPEVISVLDIIHYPSTEQCSSSPDSSLYFIHPNILPSFLPGLHWQV